VNITNNLDEPHAFFVQGQVVNPRLPPRAIANSGPIAPGQTRSIRFRAPAPGPYLYYDNLNAPVNRVMGLHGALIVMPRVPAVAGANKLTPYGRPTPAVQRLFNDFGSTPWFPGLSWQAGDPASDTPPFRQYIWLLHQASPNLFAEVGDWPAGQNYPAAQFVHSFLRDPFSLT
jgi:hypothetical protein